MPRRFSTKFATFEEWLVRARLTAYTETIKRLHHFYPQANLRQLRRHPAKRERPLGELKPREVWQLDWTVLTPVEKERRGFALRALSLMRRGKAPSLSRVAELAEVKLSPRAIIRSTNAFKKIKGLWVPKVMDRISRRMCINEMGKEVWVTINDSRVASLIGKYHVGVKRFLHTGNTSFLKTFKGKMIRDSKGEIHWFDVNPEHLWELWEAKETEEFWEIYAD